MPARAHTQAQLAPTNFAADGSQAEGQASELSSLPTTRAGATEQTTMPKELPKSRKRNSKHTIVLGQHSEHSKKESKPSDKTARLCGQNDDLEDAGAEDQDSVATTAASVKTPFQCKRHSSLFCSDSARPLVQ